MSIFNSALFVINEVYADEYVKQNMTPLEVTKALAKAGLLAPEPKVIRTREQLAALDPSTAVTNGPMIHAAVTAVPFHAIGLFTLPAVVIATGEQVRAAQQALEEV